MNAAAVHPRAAMPCTSINSPAAPIGIQQRLVRNFTITERDEDDRIEQATAGGGGAADPML
jgi:hypothetical protein